MESNELRIGNLVTFANNPKWKDEVIGKQTKIDASCFVSMACASNQFEPIALTEEVLLKCGFKIESKNECWNTYALDVFTVEISSENGTIEVCYDGYVINTPTTSLHKLQNLYFALEGEELNVNL